MGWLIKYCARTLAKERKAKPCPKAIARQIRRELKLAEDPRLA